jgi:hypothetical protein
MPLLTFYAYIGLRHWRCPVRTIDRYPTDWEDLKLMTKECGNVLWQEKKQLETILTLEHHLAGKFTLKWEKRGYSRKKVQYKRDIEFSCRLKFNPHNQKVAITQPMFGLHLIGLSREYYLEKGRAYKVPSCVPKAHQNLIGNTKSLLMEPSGQRFGDYSRIAELKYAEEKEFHGLIYAKSDKRAYMPWSDRMMEEIASDE